MGYISALTSYYYYIERKMRFKQTPEPDRCVWI